MARALARAFTRPATDLEIQRFWQKVRKTGDHDSCWLWTAKLQVGYGNCRYNGWRPLAHRFSWFLHFGRPDPALTIDHICHTTQCRPAVGEPCIHRSCVNPAHLRQCTLPENYARTGNGTKEECRYGHPLLVENVDYYLYKNPAHRECLVCRRIKDAKRYPKKYAKEKEKNTHTSEMKDFATSPKLSWELVREIRSLSAAGASQRELARKFQVSQPNIGYIVRGESWKE